MKKITSLLLCLTIALTLILLPAGAYAQAESGQASAFDELDLCITIALHQKSEGDEKLSVMPEEIIPLHDLDGNLFAYYVGMDDGSYMVINANRENPVLLEFGSEGYGNVNQLAKASNDGKLVYCGPGGFLTAKTVGRETSKVYTNGETEAALTAEVEVQINKFYDFCAEPNTQKKNMLEETKNKFVPNNTGIHDLIIGSENLPSLQDKHEEILNFNDITYGRTYGFEHLTPLDGGIIEKHCGATSAYNMLLYYRYRLGEPITSPYEVISTFLLLHSYIRNGPVDPAAYQARLKSYIENETNYSIILSDPPETWEAYKMKLYQTECALYVLCR